MENLKDQQIESQKETIQSLERKVQSLETELQKFLDPDSGTISPRFTPSKHGEAALLDQIADLQKQLGECLENRTKTKAPTRTYEIEKTLMMACAAPFMPKWKGIKGSQQFTPKYEQWSDLQDTLIESEELSPYWSHKLFKEVLLAVNHITKKMAMQKPNNQTHEKYDEPAEQIGFYFYCSNQTEHEALILLKEIVEKIRESDDIYIPGIDDILVSVLLMIQCQAIYLSCQDEPEEEEKKEADQAAAD